jgi:hypothetical protein
MHNHHGHLPHDKNNKTKTGGQICFVAAICLRAGVGLSVGHDLDSIQAWWTLYDPKVGGLIDGLS